MTGFGGLTDVKMGPPVYISYRHLACQLSKLGKCIPVNLTSEIHNQIIAVPIVMTYLYVAQKNESMDSVSGNIKIGALIYYTLKFHLGAQSGQASTTSVH